MDINKVKIVADSSCDLLTLEGVDFTTAPLKIITDKKEYIDDSSLNVTQMVTELKEYRGKSSTSCPNSSDWLEAFGEAQYIFCVTITGALSGSYNSACLAKQVYEEEHKERRVFVLNSLSAGPEITLIIERLRNLILEGGEFDSICQKINEYLNSTGLLFMLQSMQNFANNGRVNPAVAKVAGLLGIRVVGKASDAGELQPLNKCKGTTKALKTIIDHLQSLGLKKGRVSIAHCFNVEAANKLAHDIKVHFPEACVTLHELRGLCSFYAELGGILVGFEKR